jgi:hypothetical protein
MTDTAETIHDGRAWSLVVSKLPEPKIERNGQSVIIDGVGYVLVNAATKRLFDQVRRGSLQ